MDAARLLLVIDVACLRAERDSPLRGAWAVWRAASNALSALPRSGLWAFKLFDSRVRHFAERVLHKAQAG